MVPRELDAKKVGDLPHEVHVGEGLKLGFKFNFAFARGAEVNEIVDIKSQVEWWTLVVCDEETRVVGSRTKATGGEEGFHFEGPMLGRSFEAIQGSLQ